MKGHGRRRLQNTWHLEREHEFGQPPTKSELLQGTRTIELARVHK